MVRIVWSVIGWSGTARIPVKVAGWGNLPGPPRSGKPSSGALHQHHQGEVGTARQREGDLLEGQPAVARVVEHPGAAGPLDHGMLGPAAPERRALAVQRLDQGADRRVL